MLTSFSLFQRNPQKYLAIMRSIGKFKETNKYKNKDDGENNSRENQKGLLEVVKQATKSTVPEEASEVKEATTGESDEQDDPSPADSSILSEKENRPLEDSFLTDTQDEQPRAPTAKAAKKSTKKKPSRKSMKKPVKMKPIDIITGGGHGDRWSSVKRPKMRRVVEQVMNRPSAAHVQNSSFSVEEVIDLQGEANSAELVILC